MKKSKVAITANLLISILCSIVGYFFGACCLLLILFGSEDAGVDGMIAVVFILALCVLLVLKGIWMRGRIKRFKKYVALIAMQQMTSLENIAANTGKPVEFVTKDLQIMIRKKFFTNAYIDTKANEIVIVCMDRAMMFSPQMQSEQVPYVCPGCDAAGTKPKDSMVVCEYCGTSV